MYVLLAKCLYYCFIYGIWIVKAGASVAFYKSEYVDIMSIMLTYGNVKVKLSYCHGFIK